MDLVVLKVTSAAGGIELPTKFCSASLQLFGVFAGVCWDF